LKRLSEDSVLWQGPFVIWDETTPDLPYHEPRLATNGNRHVVVRPDGRLASSIDGLLWSTGNLNEDIVIIDVIWSGKDWVAKSPDERIFTSIDGKKWRRINVPWPATPAETRDTDLFPYQFRLAAGNNMVIAVAKGLTLIRDCNPLPPRRSGGRLLP